MKRWHGRTALITGASAGIGTAMARQLAAAGTNLVLTARRRERLEELGEELRRAHGVRVEIIAEDLARPGAAERIASALEARELKVDLLVNNAGLGFAGAFSESRAEGNATMMQVNMVSLVELTRQLLPGMLGRGRGDVLLISSIAAFGPVPTFAVYAATKSFVASFGQALAYELRSTPVRVTVACPGGTATEFLDVGGFRKTRAAELGSMTAEEVARLSLRAMERGIRLRITGLMNRIMMTLQGLLPIGIQLRLAAMFQRAAGAPA